MAGRRTRGVPREVADAFSALKGALIIPFSPTRGFTAVGSHATLRSSVITAAVVVALTLVAEDILGRREWSDPWQSALPEMVYLVSAFVVEFVMLLAVSTWFMSRRAGGKMDYSANAKVLGFWFAWLAVAAAIASASLEVSYLFYFIVEAFVLLWFLVLLATALSVANGVRVRSCFLPAFCALVLAFVAVYPLSAILVITEVFL